MTAPREASDYCCHAAFVADNYHPDGRPKPNAPAWPDREPWDRDDDEPAYGTPWGGAR